MNLSQLDWQTLVALMIVSASLVVFAKKIWDMIQPSTSRCGTGCGACPSARLKKRIRVTELIPLKPKAEDAN